MKGRICTQGVWMKVSFVALCIMMVSGCSVLVAKPTEAPPSANLPNPASVYCEEQGGRVDIRQDSEGNQVGMCVFEDGSECEEWALYRGECAPGPADETPTEDAAPEVGMANPASVYCEEQGGRVDIRQDLEGNEVGICVFEDGSECEEWSYFRGECLVETEPVDGWWGTLESLPEMAQFDDVFVLADSDARVEYGIDAQDPTMAQRIVDLRDTGVRVQVFGELTCGVIDVNGCQIAVTRLEAEE